jgi:hypothetical protein
LKEEKPSVLSKLGKLLSSSKDEVVDLKELEQLLWMVMNGELKGLRSQEELFVYSRELFPKQVA